MNKKTKWKKMDWNNKQLVLTYNSWHSMRSRCLCDNDNNKNYKQKGITICNRWTNNFDNFIDNMGLRPSKEYTLDRINSDGNYEPSNCRWATWDIQQNNKKFLSKIEHNGETHTIGEWCKILDLDDKQKSRIYKRHSSYKAKMFDELFTEKCLRSYRKEKKEKKCLICGRDKSCHWYKDDKICNTCYARASRWSRKTGKNINSFPEWKGIKW